MFGAGGGGSGGFLELVADTACSFALFESLTKSLTTFGFFLVGSLLGMEGAVSIDDCRLTGETSGGGAMADACPDRERLGDFPFDSLREAFF